ncbi:endonuclease/exonuclease/phosphatase family protein [Azospirillum sp.]|uniref:endonuclease/exonuclease/phosphatase family protein n=1 Tax=Azospirillum sp. TaxID=34012 RepID=UPI003D754BEB
MLLRIATFNLESLDDEDAPHFAQRIGVLRQRLDRLNADILCLQEVNAQRSTKNAPRTLRALRALLEGTGYAGFHLATGTDHLADRHNLVVASRWPVAESRLLKHDLVPPPAVRMVTANPPAAGEEPVCWDRPVLHARIALPGGRDLHVFDLHLRAPLAAPVPGQKKAALSWSSVGGWAEGFFLAAIKRAGQALETRLAVERVFDADPQALLVVAGDYNAEDRQTPVRIISGDLGDTGNAPLAARALVPLELAVPEEKRFTVLYEGQASMLDHLLVSRALLGWFRAVEVHNEQLGGDPETALDSDHAPVVAAFETPDSVGLPDRSGA